MKRLGLEWWFLLVTLWPALGVLAVGGEGIVFRLVRGRWPIPSVDDPKYQDFLVLHPLTQILIMSLPAVFVFLAYLVIRQWRLFAKARRYQAALVVFVLGLASQALVPARIWEWFWD
jgi:heme/copper-type cytochrome/quinol oxidase subunit 1